MMKLSDDLQKQLSKIYEPSTMMGLTYKGYDLSFKTDEEGNAILLLIGKKTDKGIIKGERYSLTLKKDREGKTFKDHWELKGKAS